MYLWLDDMRPAPKDGRYWVKCRSVNAAIGVLKTGKVKGASLDHDLGQFSNEGGDGIRLLDWMAENNVWPPEGVAVHSMNPVGRRNMLAVIARYAPYEGVITSTAPQPARAAR